MLLREDPRTTKGSNTYVSGAAEPRMTSVYLCIGALPNITRVPMWNGAGGRGKIPRYPIPCHTGTWMFYCESVFRNTILRCSEVTGPRTRALGLPKTSGHRCSILSLQGMSVANQEIDKACICMAKTRVISIQKLDTSTASQGRLAGYQKHRNKMRS